MQATGLSPLCAPGGVFDGPAADGDVTILQATDDDQPRDGTAVAINLARSAARIMRDHNALILSGGATAEAVLDAMDITLLTVQGEILPGLPLSLADGRQIITKSGGFGAADTLLMLVNGRMGDGS